MIPAALRSSAWVTALHAWLHGTRIRISGTGHRLERAGALLRDTRIEILGRNCRLAIAPGARLWDCSITINGDGAELVIGPGCRLRRARLVVEDAGSRLHIGAETSMTGPSLISQEGRLLSVGRDCMIAQNAEIRTSDSHAIFDESSGKRLNPARDVVLGDHVWIGLAAHVLRGARIGDGAIIGAQSLVRGEIPPACIATGTPAIPRRTGIRWVRERINDAGSIAP